MWRHNERIERRSVMAENRELRIGDSETNCQLFKCRMHASELDVDIKVVCDRTPDVCSQIGYQSMQAYQTRGDIGGAK